MNSIFKELIEIGVNIDAIKTLLKDPRFDPSSNDNYAIRHTCKRNYVELTDILLKHKKIDPTIMENNPIRNASKNGHIAVVKLLLLDSRVNPADKNNFAIRFAMSSNHIEVVKFLIPKVDISKITDDKIRLQIENIVFQMKLEEQVHILSQNKIEEPKNKQITSVNILSREEAVIEITRLMKNFQISKIGLKDNEVMLKYTNVEIK